MSNPLLYVSAGLITAVEASGRTQTSLAGDLGIAPSTLCGLLSGSRVPHLNGVNATITALCRLVGYPVEKSLRPRMLPRRRPKLQVAAGAALKAAPVRRQSRDEREETPEVIEARYRAAMIEIRARRR